MATIILQTMPAWCNGDMVSYTPFAPAIELQQATSIEQAATIGRAMIERCKDAGKGATLMVAAYGRKPNGWNTARYTSLAMNTFQ